MDSYDVIIIGTGAGGGTLARHLAPSGKRILLLERGDWLPRELDNWLTEAVFVDNRYVSPDTWYDAAGTPFFVTICARRAEPNTRLPGVRFPDSRTLTRDLGVPAYLGAPARGLG